MPVPAPCYIQRTLWHLTCEHSTPQTFISFPLLINVMPERELIVDHLKFSYEGLFNPAELYNVINSWFFEKGWDWYEKMNEEQITPTGKQIYLVLEPWKSSSDFYKITIKIKLIMTDLKEVEVEQEGQTLRLHHGLVRITYDAYVIMDRFGTWTHKPLLWLFTIISQKYFFSDHFKRFQTWVESDLDDLNHKIKSYLNVYKYTYQG